MIKIPAILKRDDGSVILAAMMILVLLTIIGISATSTSNTELNITSNAQLHKMAFFTAESGWLVMTGWLDDQYPLPTVPLGSDGFRGNNGIDDDGDGITDEFDEYIAFTTSQFNQGSDSADNDGDGVIDEIDERADLLPLSNDKWNYQYRVTSVFSGAGIAPGWDPTEFLRYNYTITSTGDIPARVGAAVSQITVTAGKIEKLGS
jgi:hypothetical protein